MPRAGSHDTDRQFELTERQRDVMVLMARGKTNFEIAQALGLSLEGAKYHVSEILAKLNVTSREEAVAAWRGHQRPANRLKRALVSVPAAVVRLPLAAKAGFGAGAALMVGVGILVVWSVGNGEPEPLASTTPDAFQGDPETPDELLGAIGNQFAAPDAILHIKAETAIRNAGGDQPAGTHEAWFDFASGRARVEYLKDATYQADVSEWQSNLYSGDDMYVLGPDDSDGARKYRITEAHQPCVGQGQVLFDLLVCGLTSAAGDTTAQLSMERTTFEGADAFALVRTILIPPPDPDESGRPTPPVDPAATPTPVARVYTLRFYADANTLLPIAVIGRVDWDPDGLAVGYEQRFTLAEVISTSSLASGTLDPSGLGYRSPAQKELDILDNPRNPSPLYWLGRTAPSTGGLPALELNRVEGRYHPERPAFVSIDYNFGSDTWLNIEIWEPRGWHQFHPLVDRAYGWFEACGYVDEFDIPGGHVRILGGFPQVVEWESGVVLQPGQPLPTPTPTPTPLAVCPAGLPTRYMAEVTFGDTVVTLNAPIGLPNLHSPKAATFNDPESLETAARALRARHAGE